MVCGGSVSLSDIYILFWLFFFFSSRRRHTRFDCDWSSDVCSSDLGAPLPCGRRRPWGRRAIVDSLDEDARHFSGRAKLAGLAQFDAFVGILEEIGRASCRERV